jgi:RHS repeat-associated protein
VNSPCVMSRCDGADPRALVAVADRTGGAAQTGATTEWSFTGEQHDATGLEYVRARYYDAGTGRFLSQDPVPLLQRCAAFDGSGFQHFRARSAVLTRGRSGYFGPKVVSPVRKAVMSALTFSAHSAK